MLESKNEQLRSFIKESLQKIEIERREPYGSKLTRTAQNLDSIKG